MTAVRGVMLLPTHVAIYVRLSKEDVAGKKLGIESTAVQTARHG